jgi:hypothetical protein
MILKFIIVSGMPCITHLLDQILSNFQSRLLGHQTQHPDPQLSHRRWITSSEVKKKKCVCVCENIEKLGYGGAATT